MQVDYDHFKDEIHQVCEQAKEKSRRRAA